MIHLVFICDAQYALPTLVALLSAKEGRAAGTEVAAHVVTPGLSRAARAAFAALEAPGFSVEIVESEAESLAALHGGDPDAPVSANHVALLKFRLPSLFPALERILYLDSDVLVRGDLSPLWETDLKGASIAAVRDSGTIYWKHAQARRHAGYFNSGVMLMDLGKMRETGAERRLFAVKRAGLDDGTAPFVDQNVFNEVFADSVRHVSIRWNCLLVNLKRAEGRWTPEDIRRRYGETVRDFDDLVAKAAIWHFSSKDKPWGPVDVPGAAEWRAVAGRLAGFGIRISDLQAARRAASTGAEAGGEAVSGPPLQAARRAASTGAGAGGEAVSGPPLRAARRAASTGAGGTPRRILPASLRSALLPPLRAWRRVAGAYHAFMIEDRIAQLDRATDEIRRLRAAMDGQRSALDRATDEIRRLRAAMDGQRRESAGLRRECEAQRRECDRLRERLSDLEPLRREARLRGINRDKIACEIELARDRPGTRRALAAAPCGATPLPEGSRLSQGPLPAGGAGEVVVSLTTYPGRVYDVHFAVHSLLSQTMLPDRLVLWLSEDEFPRREGDLPEALLSLRRRGLEIRFVSGNARAYKKLLPALAAFPDAVVVTADDDIYYPPDWLKTLLAAHARAPRAIWAARLRRVSLPGPYLSWPVLGDGAEPAPPATLFPTGCGGVLYPPGSLDSRVSDEAAALRLAPSNDDIWLWAMGALRGTPVGACPEAMPILRFTNPAREAGRTDDGRLIDVNKVANDTQIAAVLAAFPDLRERASKAGGAP